MQKNNVLFRWQNYHFCLFYCFRWTTHSTEWNQHSFQFIYLFYFFRFFFHLYIPIWFTKWNDNLFLQFPFLYYFRSVCCSVNKEIFYINILGYKALTHIKKTVYGKRKSCEKFPRKINWCAIFSKTKVNTTYWIFFYFLLAFFLKMVFFCCFFFHSVVAKSGKIDAKNN